MNGTVLVRAPSSRLAEGIVTHISRDVALARAQHAAYADALAASGWMIAHAPVAEDGPDSVFIEDTVVVCEDLAVLARPGAPARGQRHTSPIRDSRSEDECKTWMNCVRLEASRRRLLPISGDPAP